MPEFVEGTHYTIEKWRQFNNYCCVKCQYSTLWLVKMKKHLIANKHKWAFPLPPEEIEKMMEQPNGDPRY